MESEILYGKDHFYEKLYTSSGIDKCKTVFSSKDAQCKDAVFNKTSNEEIKLEYGMHFIVRNRRKCRIFLKDGLPSVT